MAYTAGQALLRITPDFSGVATAIDDEAERWGVSAGGAFGDAFAAAARESAKEAIPSDDSDAAEKGSSAGGAFADAFKARVDAALRNLPDAKIDLNSSGFDIQVQEIRAELEELSNRHIGVDITDDEAMAKLAELKAQLDEIGASSPTARVKVDTAAASAELGAFEAEVAGADGALSGLGGDAGGAGAGVSGLGGAAGESSGSIAALTPALVALAAALVPIAGLAGGALAGLPAMLAGAATGLGALKFGLGGISSALSAYSAQQTAATRATGGTSGATSNAASTALTNAATIRNAANSVASAEESLANAKQSATDSVRQANEQLISSENALADAEYNEQQAQEALTQARIDAQNALTNYQNQLADGTLGIAQAKLDVTTAQQGVAAAGPGSGSTALQEQQAQLTYEQAVQRLKDLQDQQSQLQQQASAASAAGVDGSTQVVQAQHQLLDATNAVATAQQSNTDAQTSLSEAQAAAVQKVTDANTALTNALLNQQQALAQIALAGASGGGGGGSSGLAGATNAFNADMAKLSPQGRAFVNFLIDLKGRIHDVGNEVQTALVPGLQAGLEDIVNSPLFDKFAGFLVQAGAGIGQTAKEFGQFISSTKGMSEINTILRDGNNFMSQMGGAAVTLFKAFTSIGSQATPIVQAIGGGIVNLVNAFAKWAEGGGFQKFLTWLKDNGPGIVDDVKSIVKGFADFIIAIEPLGKFLLDGAGALGKMISFVAPLVKWVGQADNSIARFGQNWKKMWQDAQQWAKDAYDHLKSAVFDPLVNFFTKTIPHTFDNVVGWFGALPKRLSDAVGDIVDKVFGALVKVDTWLDNNVWTPLSNWFKGVPDRVATAIGDFFTKAWAALVKVDTWLDNNVWTPLSNWFIAAPIRVATAIGDFFTKAWAALIQVASWLDNNVWTPVSNWFTGLPTRIAGGITDFMGTVFSGLLGVGTWLETNVWDPIDNFFTGPNGIVTRLENVGTTIGTAITGALKTVWNAFAQGWNDTLGGVLSFVSTHLGGPSLTLPELKAAGGPVNAGQPYITGEEGPELFVPGGSGAIVPAGLTAMLAGIAAPMPASSFPSIDLSEMLTGAGRGSSNSGPVIHMEDTHFHDEADIDGLMRQAYFRRTAKGF